jgi:hypothetical protein
MLGAKLFWHYLFFQYAKACSVCGGGDNPVVAKAYFDMTILMSFLPMAIFAGAALYYWYRVRQSKRQQP